MGREAEERRIRIVVVDDHELMRMGICEQIGRAPDLEVVGEAENGAEALAAVGGLRPDILLLDVGLPDISGVEVARRVRAEYPATRIAVLTAEASQRDLEELARLGAGAYLPKTSAAVDLLSLIRYVHAGHTVFGAYAGGPLPGGIRSARTPSSRQLEVLELVQEGLTNQAIAERLVVTRRTVEDHLTRLFRATDARSRSDLVRAARERGWLH